MSQHDLTDNQSVTRWHTLQQWFQDGTSEEIWLSLMWHLNAQGKL